MKNYKKYFATTTVLAFLACSSLSFAQRSQQRLDAIPEAPRPDRPDSGIVHQAGVGGNMAYASAGVLELGGTASLAIAKNVKQFNLAPSVGWFFMDNWELTGILSWSLVKSGNADAANLFSILAEPSFHLPFNDTNFGFIGMGFGVMTQTNTDTGFAFAPRIGWKMLVGRSGMLTIDLRDTFATNDVIETSRGTVLTVSNAFSMGAGYTVLW